MRSWLSYGQLFKTHKTCLLHRRYHFVKISNREHAVWILHSIKNRCQYNVVLFSTFFPLLLSVRTALTDMSTLTSDLPTLLGVTSGIAVLAGLICMVLHLFSKTRYPRHRNFTDTNLPPILYSSDTGKPIACMLVFSDIAYMHFDVYILVFGNTSVLIFRKYLFQCHTVSVYLLKLSLSIYFCLFLSISVSFFLPHS